MDYKEKTLTTPKHCDIIKETSISQTENDTFIVEETPSDSYDMLETSLSILGEEDMLAKYHNENTIYLYCVVDRTVANTIIAQNNCKLPIKLYETTLTARKAVANANIKNEVTLRFPILVQGKDMVYYDEFIMSNEMINKSKVSKAGFMGKCLYTRTLNKQLHCIEYLIRDKRIIVSPPQIV